MLVSGNLGDHHACILSARMEIENDITSDCAALNDIVDGLFAEGVNVKTMRDVTRGGLGTVINEIAESSGCMIELDEESIPVHDDVRGFSDILGLDPLYMGNEGKMIAVVPADEAEKALAAMRDTEHGKDAVIIGEVLLRNHGKVLTGLIGCSVGAIVYYFVIQIVLRLGLGTNDLKLFTALIVALFLAVPYWKGKAAAARKRSVNLKEEKNNARA